MQTIDRAELVKWADSRNTSLWVAEAIFHLADGDDDAQRIWEAPTPEESAKVMQLAWDAEDGDELYWGSETFKR